MWKSVVIAMVSVASTNAAGEWTKIEENGNNGITRYVDTATIQRTGSRVRMVNLIDYKTAREAVDDKFLSIKVVQEYDCNEVKKRILAFNTYNGNMAKGGVLYTDSFPGEWKVISSTRSIGHAFWEIACIK